MKHKVITLLLSTVLFLSVFNLAVGTQNVAAASEEGIVTASSLHLRASGSTKAKSLTLLPKGTKVQIKSIQTSWMKVYVPSKKKTGWVAKKYISVTKSTTAKTASVTIKKYVKASSTKVYASSSRNAKVLTNLKKGASVTYLAQKSSWGKIKTASGTTGWVANRDLSTTKPKVTSDKPVVETVSNDMVVYVTSDTLNIREEADASADQVAVGYRGDALSVISTASNGWGEIVTDEGDMGWVNLYYTSDSVPTNSLEGKVIVLDPGHGGKDPGALGDNNKEKDLTLATAKKLKSKLEAAGAKVLMTRTGDTYPTLSSRVAFSKKNKADVFISLHFNSSSSSSANGIDTFYWTTYKNEKALATYVQEAVIDSTGLKSRGVKTGNFQVIRENNMQAILIELGFISNPDEEEIIETSEFQHDAAEGIVNGLEAYFESL